MPLLFAALLAVGAPTSDARPSVAVASFAGDPGAAWVGLALADHVTSRLLVHSHLNPRNLQREYPLNVFGWRQVHSAARGDGIDLQRLDTAALARLRRQLGADYVLTGRYEVRGVSATLAWRLVGEERAFQGSIAKSLDELAQLAEALTAEVLGALGQTPDALSTHKLTALSLAAVKPYGEALTILSRQSLDPRAKLVLSRAEIERAHALLSAATTASPSFVRGWVERGIASIMLGDAKRAEQELVQSMTGDLEPASALGLYYFYDRQGKLDEGIQVLREATTSHLGFLHGFGYLGDAYLRSGHYHEALQVFTSYVERVPQSPWARVRRGLALARTGKHELAINETQAVVQRFPESVMVLEALASRQIDARQYAAARATLEAALARAPAHPGLLTRVSLLAIEQGKLDEALSSARRAVEALGDGRGESVAGYAHLNLGHALLLRGQRDEGFAALARAKQLGVDGDELRQLWRDARLEAALADPRCPVEPAAHAH